MYNAFDFKDSRVYRMFLSGRLPSKGETVCLGLIQGFSNEKIYSLRWLFQGSTKNSTMFMISLPYVTGMIYQGFT